MNSLVRKFAVGAVAVGSLLLVGPGGLAYGAGGNGNGNSNGTRAALRACVVANHAAGNAALKQFQKDIQAARRLPADQQQAAVDAAKAKVQAAASAAHTALVNCVNAAKG